MKTIKILLLSIIVFSCEIQYNDFEIIILNVQTAHIKLYSESTLILERDFDKEYQQSIHLSMLLPREYLIEVQAGKNKKVVTFNYPKQKTLLVEF